jgi:putative peptide zinc metalloprotease protein
LILAVPIPSSWVWIGLSVKAEGVIQVDSRQVQKVVVPEAGGVLEELKVVDGRRVRAGDILARLVNPELEVKIRVNQKEQDSRASQFVQLRDERYKGSSENARVAQEITTVTKEREALKNSLKGLLDQKAQLTLRAPRDGVVMRLVKQEEKGKVLEKGTQLCEIGDDQALQAVLLVPPSELKLFEMNSPAWIRVHGRGYNFWPGTVKDISNAEAKEIPPQLSNKAGGDIPTQQDPESRSEKPQSQHYLVAVSFDKIDDAIQPGSMCRVRIEGKSRTLWWRFRRYLTNTFNFGL